MTFPNPPVATLRVCRITQRDKHNGGSGTPSKTSAPGGRFVTAGDVNMVRERHMRHRRQAPIGAMNAHDAGS